jgi:hypothetical protein
MTLSDSVFERLLQQRIVCSGSRSTTRSSAAVGGTESDIAIQAVLVLVLLARAAS